MDWSKFVQKYTLQVPVDVTKEVNRVDVILALLDENEIAFRGNDGTLVMKITEDLDLKTIEQVIFNPIKEKLAKLKPFEKEKEGKED